MLIGGTKLAMPSHYWLSALIGISLHLCKGEAPGDLSCPRPIGCQRWLGTGGAGWGLAVDLGGWPGQDEWVFACGPALGCLGGAGPTRAATLERGGLRQRWRQWWGRWRRLGVAGSGGTTGAGAPGGGVYEGQSGAAPLRLQQRRRPGKCSIPTQLFTVLKAFLLSSPFCLGAQNARCSLSVT